jgi:hypothetical protein
MRAVAISPPVELSEQATRPVNRMAGHVPKGIIMNRKSLTDLEQSHQALEDQIADAMLHKAVTIWRSVTSSVGNSKSKTRSRGGVCARRFGL